MQAAATPHRLGAASATALDALCRGPAASVELLQREMHDLVVPGMTVLGAAEQARWRPAEGAAAAAPSVQKVHLAELASMSAHFVSVDQRPFFAKSRPETMAIDLVRSPARRHCILRAQDQVWVSNALGTDFFLLSVNCPALEPYEDMPTVAMNADLYDPSTSLEVLSKEGRSKGPFRDHFDDDSEAGDSDDDEEVASPPHVQQQQQPASGAGAGAAGAKKDKHVVWGTTTTTTAESSLPPAAASAASSSSSDVPPAPAVAPAAAACSSSCTAKRAPVTSTCTLLKGDVVLARLEPGRRATLGGKDADIVLPWVVDAKAVVCEILFELDDTLHLIQCQSPVSKSMDAMTFLFVTIPNNVLFPLCKDDVLVVKASETVLAASSQSTVGAPPSIAIPSTTNDILDFAVLRMDEPCRQAPRGSAPDERPNAHQLLGLLGVEVVSREHFSSSRAQGMKESYVSYTVPVDLLSGPRHFITVGRREGDNEIVVRDPFFASIQLAIRRERDLGYSLVPIPSAKNATKLLLGRGVSHYRTPFVVSCGEVLFIGKMQVKVVFAKTEQQQQQPAAVSTGAGASMAASSAKCVEIRPPSPQVMDEIDSSGQSISQVCLRLGVEEPQGAALLLRATSIVNKKSRLFMCSGVLDVVIGSSPSANVSLSDRTLSALHCRLTYDRTRGAWTVQDLESSRGTLVKVREPMMVMAGDVISVGKTEIKLLGEPMDDAQRRLQGMRGKRLSKLRLLVAS